MTSSFAQLLKILEYGLIVSCQAPLESPLCNPMIIGAIAEASIAQNAVAVRVNSPEHIAAVRQRISAPILGLWKQTIPNSEVYITPQFESAAAIAAAGADLIAIDATLRDRPETVGMLIERIHKELNKPVVADVDSLAAAIAAAEAGADLIATTLYGYTRDTQQHTLPGLNLVSQIAEKLDTPVLCEGGIATPQIARQALDLGAYAVVVGTAITGIEAQVQAFDRALRHKLPALLVKHDDVYHFALFSQEHPSYRGYVRSRLRQYNTKSTVRDGLFEQSTLRGTPLEVFLLDDRHKIRGGLVGLTRWNWLLIETLWVDESLRHQGFGKRLMMLAEQEAKQRGCTEAILDTLSLQAKRFYEKLGYEMFAQIDDYPSGCSFYQLKKEF